MILTLDVGNSQIFGGVFEGDELVFQFRRRSNPAPSSDELGYFLKSVLQDNNVDPQSIDHVAVCSVVPDVLHSVKNCCRKTFGLRPLIIQAGVKTGFKIRYRNPLEVGADRIANTIGALQRYPDQNLIIVDFGTATTFCAINTKKEYLGGLIVPGIGLSMRALETNTAKLPAVEIVVPKETVGRSTAEGIQAGLYYGHLGMIREICTRLKKEAFDGEGCAVLGTGGFARLFEPEGVFDHLVPDLVLYGLKEALKSNA